MQSATQVVKALEEDMVRALEGWSLEPVVRGLKALRGVDLIVGHDGDGGVGRSDAL